MIHQNPDTIIEIKNNNLTDGTFINEGTKRGNMTPAKQAKLAGLKSLSQVSEITGVSAQTLDNWAKNKPDLFRVVLAGCAVKAK